MKSSPRPPRTPCRLSESTHHRLNAYALAANAAGVGALALAQPVQARIVYTPAHVVIREGQFYDIHLVSEKQTDFTIQNTTFSTGFYGQGWGALLGVTPGRPENQIWQQFSGASYWAAALHAGVRVGRKGPFHSANSAKMVSFPSVSAYQGPWANVTRRYLGLKFVIGNRVTGNSQVHYGWARLNVTTKEFAATLTGYAYETIPNKPIIAGKTHGPDVITVRDASLGHLARGASAVPAWREANSTK